MTVSINTDTDELLIPFSIIEIKQLHLTDQFNYIEGDTYKFYHRYINLARNFYGKAFMGQMKVKRLIYT